MTRRRRTGSTTPHCGTCHRPVKWLKSPFSSKWRMFEPGQVNPRTYNGPDAFPVEALRAWRFRELVEDLMVRRQQSSADAQDEAYDMPWYRLHRCPNEPATTREPEEALV